MNHILRWTALILLSSSTSFAGGHSVGNGGDSQVIDFQNQVSEIFTGWDSLNSACELPSYLNPPRFYKTVLSTKVESTDEALYLEENGNMVLKESINYPDEMRIVFNRLAYEKNKNKKQFVLHEYLGILKIPDLNYTSSKAILELIDSRNCKGNDFYNRDPQSKNIKNLLYPSVTTDGEGMVYILDRAENQVLRYSLTDKNYRSPLKLRYPAKSIKYSKLMKRLFINSTKKVLTYFELPDLTNEKVLVRTEESINDFVLADEFVILSNGSKHYIYDQKGQLSDTTLDLHEANRMYWDDQEKFIYYVSSRISPVDIFRVKINKGKFVKRPNSWNFEDETPYHGNYQFFDPLLVNKDYIITGSNQVLKKRDLTFIKGVYENFDVGAWSPKQLAIGVPKGLNYELVKLNSEVVDISSQEVFGEIISIFVSGDTLYQVYVPTGTAVLTFEAI